MDNHDNRPGRRRRRGDELSVGIALPRRGRDPLTQNPRCPAPPRRRWARHLLTDLPPSPSTMFAPSTPIDPAARDAGDDAAATEPHLSPSPSMTLLDLDGDSSAPVLTIHHPPPPAASAFSNAHGRATRFARPQQPSPPSMTTEPRRSSTSATTLFDIDCTLAAAQVTQCSEGVPGSYPTEDSGRNMARGRMYEMLMFARQSTNAPLTLTTRGRLRPLIPALLNALPATSPANGTINVTHRSARRAGRRKVPRWERAAADNDAQQRWRRTTHLHLRTMAAVT
ncbi:hypothetical protein BJ912DRAFT_929433 [Pholiota molesta]|nr:hypothetical protein BJ912DRAFT_929433 [Pholiota molesta]